MKKPSIFALLLVLALCLPTFVACGCSNGGEETTTVDPETTTRDEETTVGVEETSKAMKQL